MLSFISLAAGLPIQTSTTAHLNPDPHTEFEIDPDNNDNHNSSNYADDNHTKVPKRLKSCDIRAV